MPSPELITLAANYGFAATMAILFWRYIKNQAAEQTKALQDMTAALKRVEKQLDRMEQGDNNG